MTLPNYIWHSSASDVTAQNLAKVLGPEWVAGSKSPDFTKYGVVLGWGCKIGTKFDPEMSESCIEQGKLRLLNPVGQVEENRDKLNTLRVLKAAGVPVPAFVYREAGAADFKQKIQQSILDGELDFPLLGHNRRHKGQPVFAYTAEEIDKLVGNEEINYVRTIVPGTEYRLHIFLGELLVVEVKSPTEQSLHDKTSFYKQSLTKGLKRSQLPPLPEATSQWISEWLACHSQGPDQILRSLGKGWELKNIPKNEIPDLVGHAAWAALDAVNLDVGAVSIELSGNTFCVTGITTAPALSPLSLEVYSQALQKFAAAGETKREAVNLPKEEHPEVLLARIRRKLRFAKGEKLEKLVALLEE